MFKLNIDYDWINLFSIDFTKYCFLRPLNEASKAKKTSLSRALLTTPRRFKNTVGSGWNSVDSDSICFTGMRKLLFYTYTSINGVSFCNIKDL